MTLALDGELDRPFSLTPEHIRQFEQDGFIHLKAVLPPDVLADYGREITRLTIALSTQTKPLE